MTNNMPAILTASFTPSIVPLESASKKLAPTESLDTLASLRTAPVSGKMIFAITTVPGAAMTDAEIRCLAKITVACGSPSPNIRM